MVTGSVPGWLLDERANAGRENLDTEHVGRCDSKMDADAAAEVALLKTLGMNDHAIVIEFGAGTGQFTLQAAPHCEGADYRDDVDARYVLRRT